MTILGESFALCRLPAGSPIPAWTNDATTFLTISRSREELSIIADEGVVPEGVDARRGYRAFCVDGPLPKDLVGIIAAMATPLAEAVIPIFPIATFDTDYVLVHEDDLLRAIAALEEAGHRVRQEGDAAT